MTYGEMRGGCIQLKLHPSLLGQKQFGLVYTLIYRISIVVTAQERVHRLGPFLFTQHILTMVFRERAREIRKKFSRGSSSTSGTSSGSSSTMGSDLTPHTTHTMYKPGERIPYKYRRPVDKKHKETLESFNFADAWNERRKSFASQYSPMGSRLPSRRSSLEFQRSMHMRRGNIGYLAEGSDEESTPCNGMRNLRYFHTYSVPKLTHVS